jgi:hypothetical protein
MPCSCNPDASCPLGDLSAAGGSAADALKDVNPTPPVVGEAVSPALAELALADFQASADARVGLCEGFVESVRWPEVGDGVPRGADAAGAVPDWL